jgi:hypothetical protein
MGLWNYGKYGTYGYGTMGLGDYFVGDNGTMGQWDNGTMGQWDNGTMGQWDNGTMEQWDNGTMGQWDNGTAPSVLWNRTTLHGTTHLPPAPWFCGGAYLRRIPPHHAPRTTHYALRTTHLPPAYSPRLLSLTGQECGLRIPLRSLGGCNCMKTDVCGAKISCPWYVLRKSSGKRFFPSWERICQ